MAASSISADNCIIAPVADLVANGMYLMDPNRTNNANEFIKNVALAAKARYAKPKAKEGIRYGKKAKVETIFANLVLLFLTTA